MTTFSFDTITPDQALNLAATDVVVFAGGSANGASVVYDPSAGGAATITVTFAGHSVTFGAGLTDVGASFGLQFPDHSLLLIGGPGNDNQGFTVASESVFSGNDAVFGGAGNDAIDAWDGDNLIQGNQGDDLLFAEGGFNTVYGGQGNDAIVFNDTIANDKPCFGQGNLGNDTIQGGSAGDTLLGGRDDDVIRGGNGADHLSGDRGDDTLSGGGGGDIFHTFGDAGVDRVLDFNALEGDRVELDPGTTFEAAQIGADTVITMGGGGQMILVGVQMSTLHDAWIFFGA